MSKLIDLIDQPVLTVGDVIDRVSNTKGYDDLADVILAIDLTQADAGFTITVIKKLFESLCGDLDYDEAKGLLKELKQINKEKHK